MFFDTKDFRKIDTCFCFMDETGLLYSGHDKFFALGLLKCKEPEKIYNRIRKVRDRYNYNEEVKWAKLDSEVRFKIAMEMFNIFLSEDIKFNCIILDKSKLDFNGYFHGDLYKVYTSFSIALMKLVVGPIPNEILIILADNYFAPRGKDMERKMKKFTNDHYKDFVVAGVCQIDSKSSDILQMTDLILGAILYDLKKNEGLIPMVPGASGNFKKKFLNFLYQKLKINRSFFIRNGFRTRNYILSGDKIRATIFDCSRSRSEKFKK